MILDKDAIRERLRKGEVFKDRTWVEESIMEASYALRVASDGLLLGGKRFKPDEDSIEGRIEIKPGEIAILSTIERLDMPGDLVGKLGIRFDYASQGLTGLMGIQVDPYFGWGHDDERLYIRVANLGNEAVPIDPGAKVFTFELHRVQGNVPVPSAPRLPMWHRLQDVLADQDKISWSFVTRVQENVERNKERLDEQDEKPTGRREIGKGGDSGLSPALGHVRDLPGGCDDPGRGIICDPYRAEHTRGSSP